MNKKGFSHIVFPIIFAGIILVTTYGFVETYKSGVLKSNGQRIWHKMLGENAQDVDAKYAVK